MLVCDKLTWDRNFDNIRERSLNNTQTKFGVSALFTRQNKIWEYASADRIYVFLWLLERKTCNDVRWCLRYMKGMIWWAFDWTNSRPVRGRLHLKHSSSHWSMEGIFSINGFCVNVNIICSLLYKVGLTIGWNDSMRKIWPLFDLFNFMVSNACKIVSYLVVRCTQPMTVQDLNQIFITINVVNL